MERSLDPGERCPSSMDRSTSVIERAIDDGRCRPRETERDPQEGARRPEALGRPSVTGERFPTRGERLPSAGERLPTRRERFIVVMAHDPRSEAFGGALREDAIPRTYAESTGSRK
jgi:hypothetical protein